MTYKTIIISLLTSLFLLTITNTYAQNAPTKEENTHVQGVVKEKAIRDKIRLQAAKDLKANTKADAKLSKAKASEIKQINKEASYAAKQAKYSTRMEAKTHHTCREAVDQAIKAAEVPKKSNTN